MGKLSPLMEQYHRMKSQCGDAILLFRMGDFYETFEEDAAITARILNITLTSRQKKRDGNRIPLAGIPYHALDAYLPKLVEAGHKVAICEQVEDPKKAKGLVKREITCIITPGTIIEPAMLEEGANNFLAAVVEDQGAVGLAFADVSTGEFLTTEISATEAATKVAGELSKFRPAECITPSSTRDNILELIGEFENLSIQNLDEDLDIQKARSLLLDHFGQDNLERFGVLDKELSLWACGVVLSYLGSAHLVALDHISTIKLYSPSEFMVLDEVTLRNLEIFRNIRDRSKRGSLLEFLDQTVTPMGSRTLRKWLQMPSLYPEEIEDRLGAVEELCKNALLRSTIRESLKGTGDLERISARTACGTASPKDMVALRSSLERLPELCQVLEDVRSSRIIDIGSRSDLGALGETVNQIREAITEDPPVTIKEGGIIREGYDDELDELRFVLREGKDWITRLERKERDRTGIKSLKVSYNNVFGYYLEVTRANISAVPEEYIRKQTLTNSERYITPELKDMEAKVLSAQERSTALEHEIFVRIRAAVGGCASAIQERARPWASWT